MSSDLQKKLDEIRANSKLHKMDNAKAIRSINNVIKKDNESFRKNVSLGKTGKKRPDMLGNKNPAHLDHVRQGKINRLKGVKKSKKQIEKYKASMKLKPDIICPYCNFISRNQGNMNRYHFDNCKHKGENK